MEYNENEWHISQNGSNTRGPSGNAQVPSSLLPAVLHRLGLPPEQAPSEGAFDDLVANLKSDDWEVRLTAARALGKLNTAVPIEPLVAALADEDRSVRAAVVHALGQTGKRAPLHRLVAALHDPDWHVRETAVLALGKQDQQTSHEGLMTALQDTDETVREAARLALEWNAAEGKTSTAYRQLREQKTMQRDRNRITPANSQEGLIPFETVPYNLRDSTVVEGRNSERVQGVQEQMLEYIPGEYAYDEAMPSRWEKLTPHRRPQRGGLVLVVVTALLFFLMGGGLALWVMPSLLHTSPVSKSITPQPAQPPLEKFIGIPEYSLIVQKDIATALHLDPKEITSQLKSGESMTAIAAAQGVSASQLTTIEVNAFKHVLDHAVSSSDINRQDADQWIQQLQNNPQLLDSITVQAFES